MAHNDIIFYPIDPKAREEENHTTKTKRQYEKKNKKQIKSEKGRWQTHFSKQKSIDQSKNFSTVGPSTTLCIHSGSKQNCHMLHYIVV